jgi:hypothetical protein
MFRRNAQQEPAEAAKRAAAAGHPAGSARMNTWATMTDRACCCPARPQVKVVMPPTAARPNPVDLWLCGHHYRESGAALAAAGADIVDLSPELAAAG